MGDMVKDKDAKLLEEAYSKINEGRIVPVMDVKDVIKAAGGEIAKPSPGNRFASGWVVGDPLETGEPTIRLIVYKSNIQGNYWQSEHFKVRRDTLSQEIIDFVKKAEIEAQPAREAKEAHAQGFRDYLKSGGRDWD